MVCSVDHLASEAGVDGAAGRRERGRRGRRHERRPRRHHAAHVRHGRRPVRPRARPAHRRRRRRPCSTPRAGPAAAPTPTGCGPRATRPCRSAATSAARPVPGCVDGWLALHERFGRLPLADVLAPAIASPRTGSRLSPLLAFMIPSLAGIEGCDDLVDGRLPTRPTAPPARRRPRCCAAIAAEGRDGFYHGEFGAGPARRRGRRVHRGRPRRSQADWVSRSALDVWGHGVWTIPPNSQGYLTLAGAGIAEGLRPARRSRRRPRGPTCSSRRPGWPAYDRPDVLARRRRRPRAARPPTRLDARGPAHRPRPGRPTLGVRSPATAGRSTCAPSTATACGVSPHPVERLRLRLPRRRARHRACCCTTAASASRSSPATRPSTAPAAGRPHTLSPALVTRPDGELRAVLGTMGGDTQPQVLLQLLARLLRSGEDPGTIIGAPRWVLGRDDGTGFDAWDGRRPRPRRASRRTPPPAWAEGLSRAGPRRPPRRPGRRRLRPRPPHRPHPRQAPSAPPTPDRSSAPYRRARRRALGTRSAFADPALTGESLRLAPAQSAVTLRESARRSSRELRPDPRSGASSRRRRRPARRKARRARFSISAVTASIWLGLPISLPMASDSARNASARWPAGSRLEQRLRAPDRVGVPAGDLPGERERIGSAGPRTGGWRGRARTPPHRRTASPVNVSSLATSRPTRRTSIGMPVMSGRMPQRTSMHRQRRLGVDEADVGTQRELEPAAERVPGHRGDDGHGHLGPRVDGLLAEVRDLARAGGRRGCRPASPAGRGRRPAGSAMAVMADRSSPAQNDRPSPESTTARSDRSAWSPSPVSASAWNIARSMAFSLSGRLSRTSAIAVLDGHGDSVGHGVGSSAGGRHARWASPGGLGQTRASRRQPPQSHPGPADLCIACPFPPRVAARTSTEGCWASSRPCCSWSARRLPASAGAHPGAPEPPVRRPRRPTSDGEPAPVDEPAGLVPPLDAGLQELEVTQPEFDAAEERLESRDRELADPRDRRERRPRPAAARTPRGGPDRPGRARRRRRGRLVQQAGPPRSAASCGTWPSPATCRAASCRASARWSRSTRTATTTCAARR